MKNYLPLVLIFVGLGLAGFYVYVSTFRSLTPLEGTLLQILILVAGIVGSVWLGRQSLMNRPHARSAFRRVTSLYSGLARAAAIIEESRDFDSVEKYHVAFARLEELVSSQLATVDDALEDWRDIVPTEVSDA